ncbi:zinc ccch-type [Nannochloropsis oceanica]
MAPFILSSSDLQSTFPSPPSSSPSSFFSSPSASSIPSIQVKTLYTVRGRVCARRPFAKCMLFFDLVDAKTRNQTRGDLVIRLECLLHAKGLAGLERAHVKKIMHDVHMGDVLEVDGFLDTRQEFLVLEAKEFRVVEAWKSLQENPRVGFVLEWPSASQEEMKIEAEASASGAATTERASGAVAAAASVLLLAKESSSNANQEGHSSHTLGNNANKMSDKNNKDKSSLPPLLLENICKYWVANQGRCYQSKGGCPKFHPPLSQLPNYYTAWLAKRQKERAHASQIEGDTHPPEDKTNKALRAVLFADWLVQTYGATTLAEGSGVVDVAGGKGDVSCRLWGEYGIRCTIVDPRATNFRKKVQQQVVRQRGGMEGIGRLPCIMPAGCLENEEEEGGEDGEDGAQDQKRRLRRVLKECSLVVGMHPDQATDGIFEAALTYGKPVACVPCCVFAREFPHRRRPNMAKEKVEVEEKEEREKEKGKETNVVQEGAEEEGGEEVQEVESYEHLIEYLMAKPTPWPGVACQRKFLPFLGRNQVLFTLPPSLSSWTDGEEGGREDEGEEAKGEVAGGC